MPPLHVYTLGSKRYAWMAQLVRAQVSYFGMTVLDG